MDKETGFDLLVAQLDKLPPRERIEEARRLVVSLLEYTGYGLAHEMQTELAKAAFALVVDVETRLDPARWDEGDKSPE